MITLTEFLRNEELRAKYLEELGPSGLVTLQEDLLAQIHPVRNTSGPFTSDRQAFIAGFETALQALRMFPTYNVVQQQESTLPSEEELARGATFSSPPDETTTN